MGVAGAGRRVVDCQLSNFKMSAVESRCIATGCAQPRGCDARICSHTVSALCDPGAQSRTPNRQEQSATGVRTEQAWGTHLKNMTADTTTTTRFMVLATLKVTALTPSFSTM